MGAAITEQTVWMAPLPEERFNYAAQLASALEMGGWGVSAFTWNRLLRSPPPRILLLHWPENLVASKNLFKRISKLILLGIELIYFRLRGTRVIHISHNLTPHEPGKIPTLALRQYRRLSSAVVHLSATGKRLSEEECRHLSRIPSIVVQHGDTMEGSASKDRKIARERLKISDGTFVVVSPGRPRSHKNRGNIVSEFRKVAPKHSVLIVQDNVTDSGVNVRTVGPELTPSQLIDVIVSADLAVLDFQQVLHSGSVAQCLSLGVPTLAPNLGALSELRKEFDPSILRLFEQPLDSALLEDAFIWAESLANVRRARPVTALSWIEIAEKVIRLFSLAGEKQS
jgi:hypothetical protein